MADLIQYWTHRAYHEVPYLWRFHSVHHSTEAHFVFIDALFGTRVKSEHIFREQYGVVGDYMPDGFVKQQLYPFRGE